MSPCVGLCKLDENKVCIGCNRTIEQMQLNEVNKYLNSQVRLLRKQRGSDETKDILNILGYS
jgi:predicted Fe-S protein YdhL (DUF1289 family)